MPDKPESGGKRAVRKKHEMRDAERNRTGNYFEDWRSRYDELGPAPIGDPEQAHQWISDVVLTAIEEAAKDFALPAEKRREQIGRLAAQAAKSLDPAKLAVRLELLEAALKESQHARAVKAGEASQARKDSDLL